MKQEFIEITGEYLQIRDFIFKSQNYLPPARRDETYHCYYIVNVDNTNKVVLRSKSITQGAEGKSIDEVDCMLYLQWKLTGDKYKYEIITT